MKLSEKAQQSVKEKDDLFGNTPKKPIEKGIDFEKVLKEETPKKKEEPKQPENLSEYPIEITKKREITEPLTLEQKKTRLLTDIELYGFMIDKVLDRNTDYHKYPNGSEHIKRSGCIKLAVAFNLSIEPVSIEIEYEYDKNGKEIDIHAHAKAKVIRPDGSYVIGTGTKSKSEYYSTKKQNYGSYCLHNLRTTAMTKATNHAIVDAIGFAQVTYEEVKTSDDSDNDLF